MTPIAPRECDRERLHARRPNRAEHRRAREQGRDRRRARRRSDVTRSRRGPMGTRTRAAVDPGRRAGAPSFASAKLGPIVRQSASEMEAYVPSRPLVPAIPRAPSTCRTSRRRRSSRSRRWTRGWTSGTTRSRWTSRRISSAISSPGARQVAEGLPPDPVAPLDRVAELPALVSRLATGPQRLQPPGTRASSITSSTRRPA